MVQGGLGLVLRIHLVRHKRLHGRVAPWWTPDAVFRLARVPLASTGKIDKMASSPYAGACQKKPNADTFKA